MYLNRSKMTKKGGAGGVLLIRILVITLLVMMPLIPSKSVFAQCENPPCETGTPEPPSPTSTPHYGATVEDPFGSTPTPFTLGDCPVSVKDPARPLSVKWANLCVKCINDPPSIIGTLVPYPTLDWEDYFNATAAPSTTSTPMPTQTDSEDIIWLDNYEVFDNDGINPQANYSPGLSYSRGYTSWAENKLTVKKTTNEVTAPFTEYTIGFHTSGTYDITSNLNEGFTGLEINFGVPNQVWGDVVIVSSNVPYIPVGALATNAMNINDRRTIVRTTGGANVNGVFDITYNVTIRPTNGYSINQFTQTIKSESPLATKFEYTYSQSYQLGGYEGTPPVDTGYCSAFGYGDDLPGGEGYGNPLIGLPNLHIWQGECIDFIPPFEWARDSSGSFLFNVDLSFPGIGVCPVWVEIEPLTIIEQEIPFEILLVPAIMFVFSLIFKM